jgi:hypothetical protein
MKKAGVPCPALNCPTQAKIRLEWATRHNKDTGVEEADPYLLAVAVRLRVGGKDARVVTEEIKDTPAKMSLNTACGLVGVPSVPLRAFLQFEKII